MIRFLARAGRVTLSQHAERERRAERITIAELRQSLVGAEVIEDYLTDPRGHSLLVLGWSADRPIHAVCAAKQRPREILVVTVYDPSMRSAEWSPDFRSRRIA